MCVCVWFNVRLAEQISSFPQECLRADRSSAIYSCFDAPSFAQVHAPPLYRLATSCILTKPRRFVVMKLWEEFTPREIFPSQGHAVWDWPRRTGHPVRSRGRGDSIYERNWTRREVFVRFWFDRSRICRNSVKPILPPFVFLPVDKKKMFINPSNHIQINSDAHTSGSLNTF